MAYRGRRFQFSIGDAHPRRHSPLGEGGDSFNSLLEMRVFRCPVRAGHIQRQFQFSIGDASHDDNYVVGLIPIGAVSILYWRCIGSDLGWLKLEKGFNSLLEMPVSRRSKSGGKRSKFQFSIGDAPTPTTPAWGS